MRSGIYGVVGAIVLVISGCSSANNGSSGTSTGTTSPFGSTTGSSVTGSSGASTGNSTTATTGTPTTNGTGSPTAGANSNGTGSVGTNGGSGNATGSTGLTGTPTGTYSLASNVCYPCTDNNDCNDPSNEPMLCVNGYCNLAPTGTCDNTQCTGVGGTCDEGSQQCTCPAGLQNSVCGDCNTAADCAAPNAGTIAMVCNRHFCQYPSTAPAGTCDTTSFGGGDLTCSVSACNEETQECVCAEWCAHTGSCGQVSTGSTGSTGSSGSIGGNTTTTGTTGNTGSTGGNGGNGTSGGGDLSCSPPSGFQGNALGVGAYCDGTTVTTCPGSGGALCAAEFQAGEDICIIIGCDHTMSSLSQCGEGACCQTESTALGSADVCIPNGCLTGACPNP